MSPAERNFRHTEAALRDLQQRQLGLVTTDQAASLGISPSSLSRLVDRGELERVLPRVYRATVVPPTMQQQVSAAVLWAGPTAVVSYAAAGAIWRIEGVTCDRVELWVPRERSLRSGRVVIHRGEIAAVDRRVREGIAITSPARTLIDLAGALDGEVLEAAVEDVLRRGLTTAPTLRRRLDALGGKGRAGAGALRDLLDDRGDAALESRLEVRVWRLLRGAGLRPVRQHVVRCRGRTYRLDFAFPMQKVAVEADGYAVHGGRRAFVRDRQRLADLAAEGWIVVPVTWDDCDALIGRVASALVRAA